MSDFFKALKVYTYIKHNYLYHEKEDPDEIEFWEYLEDIFRLNSNELETVKKFTENVIECYDWVEGDELAFIGDKKSVNSFIEKVDSVDILNATVMAEYAKISYESNPFSNNFSKVIDKRDFYVEERQKVLPDLKKKWIEAIVKGHIVELEMKLKGECITVKPLGLYYPEGTNAMKLIFKPESSNQKQDVSETQIKNIEITNRRFKKENFSVDNYLKKKNNADIYVRIYNEANAAKKMKATFGAQMEEIERKDDYIRARIHVEDPMEHRKLLESYGRSVIVESPLELRNCLCERAKKCLAWYQAEME